MNKLYIIIVSLVALSIASCTTMKNNSKGHSKSSGISEERMQMDAYAMANVNCEYQLLKLKIKEDNNNRKLFSELDQLKKDMSAYSVTINTRYKNSRSISDKFSALMESSALELTTCKQFKVLKDSIDQRDSGIKE